ncbi:MAG: hypothetical protein KGJ68_09155 [Gammaproteobacteria bacterium]|nr:hypothetical protein [Gammaproteobacteria bacterium]
MSRRGILSGILGLLALDAPPLLAQETAASEAPPGSMDMAGLYGAYDMTREASGTSWQPDSTPMEGIQQMRGPWMAMLHGFIDGTYDEQGGPRGATQSFSSSMLMLMARRELGDGAFGLRLMISSDPLMGASGYPLLFQTGETADGRVPLIDRQHPHNLLMEAAATYSRELSAASSVFLYAGPAGEPALGPTTFMHRLSGMDDPEAPLTHHWLDSTHVSYGVVTAGYVLGQLKLDASAFNGREPDQHRYDVEVRALDSYSARLTWNAGTDLSMQLSSGHLKSPEQIEPAVDVRRTTASVTYNAHAFGEWWQTTLAWGRNSPSQGSGSSGWLLESALKLTAAQTVFGRAEHVAKDELLLPGAPLYGQSFMVNALSLGYIYDFLQLGSASFGVGGLASTYDFPAALNSIYGYRPASFMVFVRVRL